MTNATIIFNESVRLMDEGIIGTTGRKVVVEMADGSKQELMEPEAIHTFTKWKELGRQVKKGEHAKAMIHIWKAKPETVEMTDGDNTITEETTRMFMKKAFFFTLDQTEAIEKQLPAVI